MNRILEDAGRNVSGFSLRRLAASFLQTTSLLGCAAIIAGNLSLVAFLDHEREQTLEKARVVARNLNTAFEQHVVRSIKNIDQTLLFARAEFERDPQSFSAEAFGKRDFFPKDIALQLAVIGPDGMMTGSSLPSSGAVDLSDRAHFKFHVNNPRDEVFISQPVLGRVSKAWSIQFTRKLQGPDGAFAGVLVASLDPYYLSRIYESIDIGASGAVTLWGLDGVIRARGGASADVLGQSPGSSSFLAMAREMNSGIYEAQRERDGEPRIVSFRRVPSYPLVVTVSVGRNEVLEPFIASKASMLQLTLLIDLALAALMALGVLESYRLRSVREHLSAKSRILSSTFANMHEGILLIDRVGAVVAINDLALDLLGLSSSSFVPSTPYARLPLAHRESGLATREVEQIVLSGGRTIEVKTSVLPDGGVVKTLNDVSARKLDHAALEDARDRAEAAARARTSFLATMSHEIRTPLGGILSMVDLLGGTKLDLVQKRYVAITRDSATHLLQLIDDVLDVTKLDADHVVFENIEFDLYRQIRSTLDIVSPRAHDKGLTIGCVVAADVPREIMGDPGRLRQVLINLLGNAIKFTATGHVLLDVSRKAAPGGDRMYVRVEDTGIGIARDSVKNLFIDFSQIDSSISRRFGGTGLGLAISRKLVTRMGGSIGVESQPDVGSVFFFDVPLRAVRPAQPLTDEPTVLAVVNRSAFERKHLCRQLARSFERVEAFETFTPAREWILAAGLKRRRIVLLEEGLAPERGVGAFADNGAGVEFVLLCARHATIGPDEARRRGYLGVVHRPLFPGELRDCLSYRPGDAESVSTPADTRPALAGKLAGQRVLIAEDNPTNQFALSRMLERMGAQVTTAINGREAVNQAARQAFDVVLMDVMMPELDGLAAAREIRAQPGPNANAPIVALTASAFAEDRDAALAAGMDAFATKPITGQSLLEAIVACQARATASVATGRAQSPTVDDRVFDMKHDITHDSQPDADAGPALDRRLLDQLREDLGPEHMEAALKLFFQDLAKRVAALRSGERTATYLRKEAHALKGSAASFGFRHVAAAAARLEDAARNGDAETFDALLESLFAEADAAPNLLAA